MRKELFHYLKVHGNKLQEIVIKNEMLEFYYKRFYRFIIIEKIYIISSFLKFRNNTGFVSVYF